MALSSGVLIIFYLLFIFLKDASTQNVIPYTVQEFHACVGTTAYIPWPLNVTSRSGHDAAMITLTFQYRRSEIKMPIATFNSHRKLIAKEPFGKRLVVSHEYSGVLLKRVSLDDAGMFIAQARMKGGDLWTRTTNLIVHLRPIVVDERLNVSIVRTTKGAGGQGNCITLSCGKLEYVGYPAAQFVWMSESKVLSNEVATDSSYSKYELCSPFHGQVSCAIAGHSSTCTFDHVVSISLDLPGPPGNASAVKTLTSTSEYLLMIGMPALAIGVPVIVLGLWLLSHLLKSRSQNREHRQADANKDHSDQNHQPPPPFATVIDVNSDPSTSHNNQSPPSPPIEDLTMSQSITFDKDDGPVRLLTRSPIRRREPEPQARPNTPHRPAHDSDDDEEEDDDDDEEEDDSDEEPDEDHKENQPLMEDSIPPTIL